KALASAAYLMADIKYDGCRGELLVMPEEVNAGAWFQSRVDKPFPALEHLDDSWHNSDRWDAFLSDDEQPFRDGLMIDGELMVKGVDFNTGSGLLRTKWLKPHNEVFACKAPGRGTKVPFCLDPARLQMVVYAVLQIDAVVSGEEYDVPNFLMREYARHQVRLLTRHFPEIEWILAESYEVYSMEELSALYEQKRNEGHEGLVVKDPEGIYKRGKKSGWWKMKPENEIDGTVCGLVWGTEGLANAGKVIGFEVLLENGRVVNACGITQAQMEEFTAVVLTTSYRTENPYEGYQVQVKFMEETPDGSLRHPSFVCFRGTEDNPKEKM
ncbi:MAG: ATP-dependent DNA ligase, partial [Spirochaetia bacterium]|nr:ATP-dependent DNA ligase [Spirochaetia bacterium]